MKAHLALHIIAVFTIVLLLLPTTQDPHKTHDDLLRTDEPFETYDSHLGTRKQLGVRQSAEDLARHATSLGIPEGWPKDGKKPTDIIQALGSPLADCFKINDGALHFFYVREWGTGLPFGDRIAANWWVSHADPPGLPKTRNQPVPRNRLPQRLVRLNTKTLELFDAKLLSADAHKIASIKSLTHLGLPKLGVHFEPGFSLPPNLKKLVVRNSLLNDDFFAALDQLESLEILVLTCCSIPYPDPRPTEWGYDLDTAWDGLPRPFASVSDSIISLTVTDSDPLIFNYIVAERWNKLETIHFTASFRNMFAFNTLFGGHPEIRTVFPNLQDCTVELPRSLDGERFEEKLRNYQKSAPPSAPKIHLNTRPTE